MNQYKKLTINTVILMLGTMGSKVITFLMLPFYTNVLSASEYGTIDLMLQIGNFLIPFCTIGITSGIIRFGLDDRYRKKDVFTTGVICFGIGFTVCLTFGLFSTASPFVESVERYIAWILAFIAASSMNFICITFVRSEEKVRTYAVAGIINTICNVLLMILFLKFFKFGITGYMMAVISADIISVSFLTFSSKLWKFIDFKNLYTATTKEMVNFSLPIIPSTISWWIIEMSDRFMIWFFIGTSANGIYSVAAKIPSIITVIAGVFLSAWQISIISTKSKKDQSRFFSNIVRSYQALLFVMASFVTLSAHFIITLLTSAEYYEAWQYVPFLISATVFSCLSTFIGSIYTIEKKSISMFVTNMVGAISNVLLNWILIPLYGIYGATIATFASYVILFVIRMIDTRKYIKIDWSYLRFSISFSILIIQNLVMIIASEPVYPIQTICVAGLLVVNFKPLLNSLKKMFGLN